MPAQGATFYLASALLLVGLAITSGAITKNAHGRVVESRDVGT
jgi:hypothetical protein